MRTLMFVVPAHGRHELTAICLRQLRRTCEALTAEGLESSAVVVACDENLDTARGLGFGTVERDNLFLSRRFNDGLQLACDPAYNPRPADYAVPCGSDDWVDYRVILDPPHAAVLGFQQISFVREDGLELTARHLGYEGGSGIRVYPRHVLGTLKYRPADEDRERACDTSILVNLKRVLPALRVVHRPIDPRQVVDWKSTGPQKNTYEAVATRWRGEPATDPFEALAGMYPAEALAEMAAFYGRTRELACA